MDNKILLLVGVIAIVAIADGGAYYMLSDDSDDDDNSFYENATLWILGNANNDRVIDSKDIDEIESIISSSSDRVSAENYKMADANNDGYITQADIDWVNAMINKTIASVHYINVDGNIREYKIVDKVNLITFHRTTARAAVMLSSVAGDNTQIVGMDSAMTEAELKFMQNQTEPVVESVGSLKSPDPQKISKLEKTYSNVVVLAGSETSYVSTFETTFKDDDGVQIVRPPTWEGDDAMNGVLTMGYLFAGFRDNGDENALTKAIEYCDWHDRYRSMIENAASKVADEDKPTIITMYSAAAGSSDVVLGPKSGDCEYSEIAGGKNLYKLFGSATRNNWTLESFAAAEKSEHIDVIVSLCGKTYGGDASYVDSFANDTVNAFNGYISPETTVYGASWDFSGVGYLMVIIFYATPLYPDDSTIGSINMEEVYNEYLNLMGSAYAADKNFSNLSLWSEGKHTTKSI